MNKINTLLGHPCELISLKTGKEMDLEVVGKYETCVDCALAKISQKKINQENINKSTIPGERIYFDLSSVQSSSLGEKMSPRHWLRKKI